MKLGAIVLEGQQAPDKAVIYIIKNEGEILYIGKSNRVENRLAQHMGYNDNPPLIGYFDEFARAAIPSCREWDVDFVEIPDDILDSGSQARVNYWIKDKEATLIRNFSPKYNILNRFE